MKSRYFTKKDKN